MSKRLRVTSRLSKRGRSLRPRSFPPRNPESSIPPPGQLDFDTTPPPGDSVAPPEPDDEGSNGASSEGDAPFNAEVHSDPADPIWGDTGAHASSADDDDAHPSAADDDNAQASTVDEDEGDAQASSADNDNDAQASTVDEDEDGGDAHASAADDDDDAQASSADDDDDAQASSADDDDDAQASSADDDDDAHPSAASEDVAAEPIEQPPSSTDAISGEFFGKETESVPPSVDNVRADEDEDDSLPPGSLSPEAIARQARLRKVVGVVLGGIGVLAMVVVGKTLVAPNRPSAPPPALTAAELAPSTESAVAAEPAAAPPEPGRDPQPAASAEVPGAADSEAPAASAAPAEEPPIDIIALKKETESLMNRGKFKEAIDKARVAIAHDPSDALPYLYLGSSLQESGQWKEGVEVYSECVRHATKGPIHECRAMGGRK